MNLACARFFAPGRITKDFMNHHNQEPAFKSQHVADQVAGENAWRSVCTKLGQTQAANMRRACGDSAAETHENRKVMRRAVNKMVADIGAREFTSEENTAANYAASVIAFLDDAIDRQNEINDRKKSAQMRVMRSADDFNKHYNTARSSFGEDGGEMNIADFLRGVSNMGTTPAVKNALSVGTDTAGGFSVPSRLMPGILAALAPVSSLLRAGAGIVPIEDGAKTFTTAAVNTIPTAAWRAEAGTLATSDPAFRAVVATPRSLAFQFKISRELLADGQNITEALYLAIAQSFARELDRVGLRGTGTAPEPRGVLNTVGIQAVTNGANGASLATLRYGNLFSAVQAILQADAPMPTAAIMSPRSLVGLGQLADTTNQPLRIPGMLEPVQLIGTSQIPNNLTVGTSTDCTEVYLGDFSNLYFMMRENVSVQVLQELYAGTGEIGFACHMRADVVLTYPAAFAVVTGVRP